MRTDGTLSVAVEHALHDGSVSSVSAARLAALPELENTRITPVFDRVAGINRTGVIFPSLRKASDFTPGAEVGVCNKQDRKTVFKVAASSSHLVEVDCIRGGHDTAKFALASLMLWRMDEFYILGRVGQHAVHSIGYHVLQVETALGASHPQAELAMFAQLYSRKSHRHGH